MPHSTIWDDGRNAFEVDNARNQYERQLPRTFVPTKMFWSLFSAKNQIVVGTRGSGKTAILKMLSLPYLVNFDDDDARRIVGEKRFIGIYVPVTTLWLGPIKSRRWDTAEEKGLEFLWHFSIAACQALTKTAEAALSTYHSEVGQRLSAHAAIISRLSTIWFPNESEPVCASFAELRERLGDLPLQKNLYESTSYIDPYGAPFDRSKHGPRFYSPVLDALLHGISVVQRVLGLSDDSTSWLICLDEVETLDVDCQVIINSFMRSDFGNRYFKIATLPYAHKTLRTNLAASLQIGHDFEYLWIGDDPATHENSLRGAVGEYSTLTFARTLYNKRREFAGNAPYTKNSLDRLLGRQSILSPVEFIDSGASSAGSSGVLPAFDRLAKRHFNEPTLKRIVRLRSAGGGQAQDAILSSFGDQLLRKTLGFLLLRDAMISRKGSAKLDVYSGADVLVRLADGNARTFIRLLNSVLRSEGWRHNRSSPIVSRSKQHEAFTKFSRSTLERIKSEEEIGQALFGLINGIGSGLGRLFYSGRVGSDVVGQVVVNAAQFGRFRSEFELGMQLGLIRMHVRPGSDFALPTDGGTFRLSYALCPAFRLMPRRGRAHALEGVLGGTIIDQSRYAFGPPIK